MSTFCHGVASAQSLDKSSEIVDIKGLDITSLPRSGVVNYEHRSDFPGQICGKILTAKKIFSKSDCSNDNELHFWNKCKNPFVYITAELLDDYCQSGKDAAGLLKYSKDNPDKEAILGFSVEGSEIPNTRKGMLITRSIARKVTLTASPCNSQCITEILENSPKSQVKDDFEELFRSEQEAITLFKSGEGEKMYETFLAKKEDDASVNKLSISSNPVTQKETRINGVEIGTTKSGKRVFSHGHVGSYKFNPSEHKEAGEFHRRAIVTSQNPKLIDNHLERMKQHNRAALSGARQDNEPGRALKTKDKNAQATGDVHKSEINKADSLTWSKGKTHNDSVHWSHPEHGVVTVQKQPSGKFHVKHHGGLAGVGGVKGVFDTAKEAGSHAKKYMQAVSQKKIFPNMAHNHPSPSMLGKGELKKAIEAGSYNGAPSTLTNGAAYQRESLSSNSVTTGAEDNSFQATHKKDWKKRADEDYDRWPHKEKFEKFMKSKMPHLAREEIRAIGKMLALKKNIDLEKSLASLISINKSEETRKELDQKSLKDIQIETAKKWADRAEEAYKKAIKEKSIKWLLNADEYFHEAIEHSSLSEELSTFESIRKKLMPIRKEAFELLAPGADA